MFNVTKYPHGTISWADGVSTDAASGKQFYMDLMGWTAEDLPIDEHSVYTMFRLDGRSVAGFVQMLPQMQAQGIPSHWQTYITVDDVDALAPKVTELGGTVVAEPFDVFDNGRMIALTDPTGATVALWQANNHPGAEVVNKPGAMCWNELYTRDIERAEAFYGALLGWTFEPMDGPMTYHFIQNNGRMNGGVMVMPDDLADVPPHWLINWSVADVEAALAKLKDLGGSPRTGIEKAEGIGRFVVFSDPQGAVSVLAQLDNPMPWAE